MSYDKIYLKITTVPNQSEIDLDSTEMKVFRSKYESSKGFIKDSEVEMAYKNEGGVNGSFSKIHCMSLGFVHETDSFVKTMYGNERDLLEKLLTVLRQEEFSKATVVMYNREFILSFLSKRFRAHKFNTLNLPAALQVYDKKPWTLKGSKCIQDYVKGISYFNENFDETCFVHGINPDFISPGDVNSRLRQNKHEEVYNSDIRYVDALIKIDRELSGEEPVAAAQGIVEEIGVVVKEPVNVLSHILASGQLTGDVVMAIATYTEENNLDKEDVLLLVKTALSKTKDYQNVLEEDYQMLEDALGLSIDYSMIQRVADKGNLTKKEANKLCKEYKTKSVEEKTKMVDLLETFLIKKGKMDQKVAKAAFDFVKKELNVVEETA